MKLDKYYWYDNLGKFTDYTCKDEEGLKSISWFIPIPSIGTPLPRNEDWKIPTLEANARTKKHIPDCINSAVIEFISEHAKLLLTDILERSEVKLYPVNVNGVEESYYMVVPAPYEEGKNMDIFALEEELPYKKFVTQNFIDIVESNGLTGFCFQADKEEPFYVNENLVKKKSKVAEEKTPITKRDDWIQRIKELSKKQDWYELEKLCHEVKQSLIDENDVRAMISNYDNALKSVANEQEYQNIKPIDMNDFKGKLSIAFENALLKANDDDSIKAIYCEYFHDSGDCCDLDLFLCEQTPDEDESWASQFGENGVVEGPSVFDLMNYDPELEFGQVLEIFATQYIESLMISAIDENIQKFKIRDLPVGFSKHDGMPVILKNAE